MTTSGVVYLPRQAIGFFLVYILGDFGLTRKIHVKNYVFSED